MSQQSSWDAEVHRDPHWILTVWPGGKLVLTTPSEVSQEVFYHVSTVFQEWLASEDNHPLIIGDCLVQVMAVPPQEVVVEREVGLRSPRAGVHRGAG